MDDQYPLKNASGCTDLTAFEAIKKYNHENTAFVIKTPALDITIRAFYFFPCSYTDAKFVFGLALKYCTPEERQRMLRYLCDHQKYMTKLENLETLIKNITLLKSLSRKGDK